MTLPLTSILLTEPSARMSQKRILLSKWPLMIVVPAPSDVTTSLQLDPTKFVWVPANHKWTSPFQSVNVNNILWFVHSMLRYSRMQMKAEFFYPTSSVPMSLCCSVMIKDKNYIEILLNKLLNRTPMRCAHNTILPVFMSMWVLLRISLKYEEIFKRKRTRVLYVT